MRNEFVEIVVCKSTYTHMYLCVPFAWRREGRPSQWAAKAAPDGEIHMGVYILMCRSTQRLHNTDTHSQTDLEKILWRSQMKQRVWSTFPH